MARLIAVVSTAFLLCLAVAIFIYLRLFAPGAPYGRFNSGAIVREVRQLNELVTVRYSIEKVVGLKEQKSPFGAESILLLVQGKVLAGINLSELSATDIALRGTGSIAIHLSKPHIEEAFIDEKYTKVWDRSVTWWTPWVSPDLDLEHKARMQAISDIKDAALNMGILSDAQRNAEISIRALLRGFGIERVIFDYSS